MRTLNEKIIPKTWMFLGVLLLLGTACGSSQKDEQESEEITVAEIEDVWLIDEHQYNDIAFTSMATTSTSETAASVTSTADAEKAAQEVSEATAEEADAYEEAEMEEEEEEMVEAAYEIATAEALEEDLLEQEYEVLANTVVVTEVEVPLEETQTLVSYAKKDKNDAAIQVITNLQTGEVEQITFVDKKHQDVYDVQAGSTGKEVKKLRKEMKHMVKNGQVFLYDDQSNIMYLMDAQNMEGDEITAADVETMEVQSIVWKDKKHHKKNKNK